MSLTHGGGLVFIVEKEDAATSTDENVTFKLDGRKDGLRLDLSLRPERQVPSIESGKHPVRQPVTPSKDRFPGIVAIPEVDKSALARVLSDTAASATKQAADEGKRKAKADAPLPPDSALFSQIQFYSRIPVAVPELAATPGENTLDALAEAMTAYLPNMIVAPQANMGIPVAYTYFGQFLAHDMSFMDWDPALNGVGGWINAQALHALDFRSLFGTRPEAGPRTSAWEERADSALGLAALSTSGFQRAFDLPRAGAQGLHCCPDARADTNLALAQMQVLLLRFHQKASVDLGTSVSAAKETTRRHLQAVVLTDYLERIIPNAIYQDVMTTGRKLVHTGSGAFWIPIEFAAACFRFGHSMVRENYVHWTLNFPTSPNYVPRAADLSTLTHYTENGGGLVNGCQPFTWCQAWRHMIDNNGLNSANDLLARPIQASLAPMFRELGQAQFPDAKSPVVAGTFNLAKKTLFRGSGLGLPSGQSLAQAAGLAGSLDVGAFMDARRARFGALADDLALTSNTPLWFYILAEAEDQANSKLGPLGARIVMETFHAALQNAENSILSVAASGATSVSFNRELRLGFGATDRFSLSDVVAVANGGLV